MSGTVSCVEYIFGICFVRAQGTASLFGFAGFLSALALLAIVYTVSDVQYKFRLAVAPTRLAPLTFILIGIIGFGTLLTEVWVNERWLVPASVISLAMWQGTLGFLFLVLVLTWLYYAFIRPPTYSRRNYRQYAQELFRVIVRGSDTELPLIAQELTRSAKPLVEFAARLPEVKAARQVNPTKKKIPNPEGYAHDVVLMIANRKFCRHIAASSPATAIRFFEVVAEKRAFHIPIGLFAQNISTEVILNTDSILYHEDEGYTSGLLGYIKPLSQALYGNYEFVERLEHNSPLDVDLDLAWSWRGKQFEAYCRVVGMTWRSYLNEGQWGLHSYSLYRALGHIKSATGSGISEMASAPEDYFGDPYQRVRTGVKFLKDAVDAIGELKPIPKPRSLRLRKQGKKGRPSKAREDFYDDIAAAMSDVIHSAAYVSGPPDKAWSIHHNAVWGEFFNLSQDSRAWRVVHFKLRRLLYEEVLDLERMPNYKAARILGICLNVMGLKLGKRGSYGREYYALKKAVLSWTKKNYLRLREVQPEVADACLIGTVTFEDENARLVKAYFKGLSREAPKEYLPLERGKA